MADGKVEYVEKKVKCAKELSEVGDALAGLNKKLIESYLNDKNLSLPEVLGAITSNIQKFMKAAEGMGEVGEEFSLDLDASINAIDISLLEIKSDLLKLAEKKVPTPGVPA